MKSKKIAIFAGYYLPTIGGYIKNIHELARRLCKKGYSVDVITCNTENSALQEIIDGVNVYRIPSWDILSGNYPVPKLSFTSLKMMLKILRKDYDAINTQTRFFFICFIGWLISILKRIPLIHLERGTRHSVLDSKIATFIGMFYDHTIGTLIVKTSSLNLGVSKPAVEFMKHLGAKDGKVMYNGIDVSMFENNAHVVKGLDFDNYNSSVTVTFMGRLIYAKGMQDLITIFPKLKGRVRLLIVGDGSYRKELEKISKKVDAGNIIFLGEKKTEEIPDILNITDIFVNPSYSEGLPTSVMEACAAGRAVVATDVGGTNEIIQDGETGFLITPENLEELKKKIDILIENPSLRKELGSKAREYVKKNFSWDEIVEKWVKEIEMVISKWNCKTVYLCRKDDCANQKDKLRRY